MPETATTTAGASHHCHTSMEEEEKKKKNKTACGHYHCQTTWRDFQQALYAPPTESFHGLVWVFRFAHAAAQDVLQLVGGLFGQIGLLPLDRLVPIVGLTLLGILIVSYIWVLRRTVIPERWCGPDYTSSDCNCCWLAEETTVATTTTTITTTTTSSCCRCYWLWIHDAIVTYLSVMVLFYFVSASFWQSPGMVSATTNLDKKKKKHKHKQDARLLDKWCYHYQLERLDDPMNGSTDTHKRPARQQCVPGSHVVQKDKPKSQTNKNTSPAVSLFTQYDPKQQHDYYYPDPYVSFCQHCQHLRPPRSHHCSTCGVCILQYNHHCVWLGTCIGYGNYRSFVGLIFFLSLACAYGVYILFAPFYEPLRMHIDEYGYKSLLFLPLWNKSENETAVVWKGVGNLPTWQELWHILANCPEEQYQQQCQQIVVDVLYPLVCGVGAVMAIFLGQHVKYIRHGHTTLEHRVIVEQQLEWWKQQADMLLWWWWPRRKSPNHDKNGDNMIHNNNNNKHKMSLARPQEYTNLFDQGWHRNLLQVVGKQWWLFFWPIPVNPPAPYLPPTPSRQWRD